MTARVSAAAVDGLPVPRRYWAALATWLAASVITLDTSMVNMALPVMARDFSATATDSVWVVTAFQVAVVLAVLPLASLGDLLGYRRIFCGGLLLFVVAAWGCAMAPSLLALEVLRFFQGLGGAGAMAVNAALLRFTFPHSMLGRGIGYSAVVIAVSSAAGPAIAAAILSVASWHWLFAIQVPLGIGALAIGLRNLPPSVTTKGRFDVVSAALSATAVGALFLAASAAMRGAPVWQWLVALVLGTGAAYWVIVRERRAARPLIPLDLIGIPTLRFSYLASVCAFSSSMAGLVALPFYLQLRFGLEYVQVGLLITAAAVSIACTAPIAGRLVERIHASVLGAVGLTIAAIGWLAMAALPATVPIAAMFFAMVLCGAGFGLFQTPNNRTMVGFAPSHRSGAAAGMLTISRLVGQTCGGLVNVVLFKLAGADTRWTMMFAGAISLAGAGVTLRQRILRMPVRASANAPATPLE